MSDYDFSSELLSDVFDQAEQYCLEAPGADEFIASEMAEKDPKGRTYRQWDALLQKMVKDNVLTVRGGRHPTRGNRCKVYRRNNGRPMA